MSIFCTLNGTDFSLIQFCEQGVFLQYTIFLDRKKNVCLSYSILSMFLTDKLKWHLVRISENWADLMPWKSVIYVGKLRERGLCEVWAFRWNMKRKTRLLAFIKELMGFFTKPKFFLQTVVYVPVIEHCILIIKLLKDGLIAIC